MMYWYSTELIGASRLRWCTEQRSIYQDEKNKRQVAEQLPGVTTFVLIISLAMRFVVLYTWIKETCPQSSLIVKKWTTYIIWVAFGFMFIGNPEEKSIDPPFQLQQRNSWWDGIITTIFSRTSTGHSFFSSKVAAGQQHHSTASDQETCNCGRDEHPVLSVLPRHWLDHPWLPQDDRLSYRESLSDSGVSRTWGRLGEMASSGRSLSSSSPGSRLISGTLGVRVFPLRLIPDWAGTGRLPGSTTRLEEGPPAFMPWEDAERWETFQVMCFILCNAFSKLKWVTETIPL